MSDARIQPLIISAPFGNYIQPRGTTPTLGTFTAARRPGRLLQILRTVRHYRRIGAWVNKIGLRNPGIDSLVERVQAGRADVADKIVSIHGFSTDDWYKLLEQVQMIEPLAIELNMSCPNVGEVSWPADLFEGAIKAAGKVGGVIVKLPPVNYELMARQALEAGVRTFHCCNTLPVPAGGMSGKPLKPVALACIRDLRSRLLGDLTDAVTLIGGGGITTTADIDDYIKAGVQHVAVGTKVMSPLYLLTDKPLRPLIEHAGHHLQPRVS
ncbi:MAG: hypothetical protein WD294_01300 [Phycisphaeraceae bacterium]